MGPGVARFLVMLSPPGFEQHWVEWAALLAASSGAPGPNQTLVLQ
jgi:hypothetical protein